MSQFREINLSGSESDDAQALLHNTHATLLSLQQAEEAGLALVGPAAPDEALDWQKSIARHAVTCLECGETFKQLSDRHLRRHDLDQRSYRTKYGIPRTQALSARVVTARRRELARQIRPWELAHGQRAEAMAQKKSATVKAPARRAASK